MEQGKQQNHYLPLQEYYYLHNLFKFNSALLFEVQIPLEQRLQRTSSLINRKQTQLLFCVVHPLLTCQTTLGGSIADQILITLFVFVFL